jgi:hypothetical protein
MNLVRRWRFPLALVVVFGAWLAVHHATAEDGPARKVLQEETAAPEPEGETTR